MDKIICGVMRFYFYMRLEFRMQEIFLDFSFLFYDIFWLVVKFDIRRRFY